MILIVLLSIICAAIVLALFFPLLRGVPNPLVYFTNGGQRGSADLAIRRRVLMENLRDIRIERELGKLAPAEYEALVTPIVAELEQVEARRQAGARGTGGGEIPRNRLGWICPDCGNLNHLSRTDTGPTLSECVQCGRPAQVAGATPGPADAGRAPPKNPLIPTVLLAGALGMIASLAPAHALRAQPADAGAQAGSRDLPEAISFEGTIANGTRGGAGSTVERLELISLDQGAMQIVQVIENAGPRFRFAPVPRPTAPHLIRATYRGESYATMVPPAPNFYMQPQEITVFESGAPRQSVQITGAMRVTKTAPDGLAVQQFLVLTNESRPPRSFDPRGYRIYIPEGARDIRANLQHESTRMPIPVEMEAVPGETRRFRLNRGVRPGNSQLVIDYALDNLRFTDYLPQEDASSGLPPARQGQGGGENPHALRIVFWQPASARPQVSGARANPIEIPNVGAALRVSYPTTTAAVTYDFSAGGVFVENPLESDTNPLFDTPWQTLVGVLSGVIAFFLIASVIAGSGLRLVSRKPRT